MITDEEKEEIVARLLNRHNFVQFTVNNMQAWCSCSKCGRLFVFDGKEIKLEPTIQDFRDDNELCETVY